MGFDITVYAVRDPEDYNIAAMGFDLADSYSRNEWEYVIVTTVASRAGIELGYSHVEGVPSGEMGTYGEADPFAEAMNYGQVVCAIEDAQIMLNRLLVPVSDWSEQGR